MPQNIIEPLKARLLTKTQAEKTRLKVGLATCCVCLLALGCLFPNLGDESGPRLTLPDMDGDGKAEELRVQLSQRHGPMLRLLSTHKGGHDHLVLPLPAAPDGEFQGESPWWLTSDRQERLLEVRLVQGASGVELLAIAGEQAKRYIFVEKGFLKLDAHEIIPGFSAGLLMLGDARSTLESINGAIAQDGTWEVPIATPIKMHVVFNAEGHLTRVTTQSPRVQIQNTWGVGSPLSALAARYPGVWQGENWASPRYGLRIQRDETGRVLGLSVSRPWSVKSPVSQ